MSHSGLIRSVYFYLVTLLCLIFFVSGVYTLGRTLYVYTASTEVALNESKSYIHSVDPASPCNPFRKSLSQDHSNTSVDCTSIQEQAKKIWFHDQMIHAILSIVLSAFVFVSHWYILRYRVSKSGTLKPKIIKLSKSKK